MGTTYVHSPNIYYRNRYIYIQISSVKSGRCGKGYIACVRELGRWKHKTNVVIKLYMPGNDGEYLQDAQDK